LKGLKSKKYVHISRKRFDPFALIASFAGLGAVLYVVQGVEDIESIIDLNSLLIVGGGTISSLLFQFDFGSFFSAVIVVLKSFLGSPEKQLLETLRSLDEAILTGTSVSELREGSEITGELLGDIVCMYRQGLLFEEIDEFVTSRVADEYLVRKTTVALLNKAAVIAPSLGLFGTVMGLIGVLKSLNNPAQIGPAMSMALMTTAYGAGFGSLIFTPLAGRVEHQNSIFLENHRQLLSKIAILLKREDRRLDKGRELILDVAS
jgi:chemotaxis protein MotA